MDSTGYDHTQYGKIHWLIKLPAVVCFIASFFMFETKQVAASIVLGVGVVLFLLSFTCFWLRVHDIGEHIKCTFGPFKLLSKKTAYAVIAEACVSRSKLIDGWGIHKVPGRGWTYNIWGFDCVELKLTDGKLMRIGTDEPQALCTFIQSRISGASEVDAN